MKKEKKNWSTYNNFRRMFTALLAISVVMMLIVGGVDWFSGRHWTDTGVTMSGWTSLAITGGLALIRFTAFKKYRSSDPKSKYYKEIK